MSIWRSIGKLAKKAAGFIPGPIGAVAKLLTAGGAVVAASRAALPVVARIVPGVGQVVVRGARRARGPIGRIVGAAGTAATGAAIYDAAGNYMGDRKKHRGINPMNMKAAKRALRRIERAKKLMSRLGHITIRKEKC